MKKFLLLAFFLILSNLLQAYYPINIETRLQNQNLKFLNADLYSIDTTRPKPVILIQTPYNKNLFRRWESGNVETPLIFDTLMFNYVMMDWRGFFSNKMQDTIGYNRGLDGYDAVEWIAKQKWCNGKVGTWGGSALGMIQFLTAFQNPPHLVCAAPFIKDFKTTYEDYYYGGVYRKEYTETLIQLGFMVNPDKILSHPSKDALWLALEKITDKSDLVRVPMLLATGWFDQYPGDVINAFEELQKRSDKEVRNQHKMIIGPWLHVKLGQVQQGVWEFPEAEMEQDKFAKSFFDYYLLNAKNGYPLKPKVTFFEMGTNQWLYYDNWSDIPRSNDTLYLNSDGKLLYTPPPPIMGPKGIAPDTILYDPRDPSPTFGGARFKPFNFNLKMGPQDISQIVESRDDNVIFTSELRRDPLIINGSVKVQLFTGSNRKDTDFGIRLCEVFPDGRSVILTQGIKRMRFRESVSEEVFMENDSIYFVEIELEPLSIRLHPESRLRIVITGSNYPMFEINLNNGDALYEPGDTLLATNLVFRKSELASRVIIPYIDQPTDISDENLINENNVLVYPNPTGDFISISSSKSFNSYRIVNVYGEIVIMGNLKGQIDVSAIPQGTFFIQLFENDSLIDVVPFIIAR